MVEQERQNIPAALVAPSRSSHRASGRLLPILCGEARRAPHRQLAADGPGHPLRTPRRVREPDVPIAARPRVEWIGGAQFRALDGCAPLGVAVGYLRRQWAPRRSVERRALGSLTATACRRAGRGAGEGAAPRGIP